MAIIQQKESGALDIGASRVVYLAQGKPRRKMLQELFYRVRAVCSELTKNQVKIQVRLAANAIFAESKETPIRAFTPKGRRMRGLKLQ